MLRFSTYYRATFLAVGSLLSAWSSVDAVLRHPDMTDAEALALGALPQFESKVQINGCTASMLNSEWAVSAAHCINLADEARVFLTYTRNGQTQSVGATAYRVQSGDGGYDDVMLVHLDSPIAIADAWVAPYDRYDEYDQLGWQVGYGTSGALGSGTASGGAFRAMSQRVFSTKRETDNGEGTSITPQFIYYNYNGSPEATTPNAYTTSFEGGTGPGDSGGPFYLYSRGRYFNASVVSGPSQDSNSDYRNSRLSTHAAALLARSGLEFAYPQALRAEAVWDAQALTDTLSNGGIVSKWVDSLNQLSWSNAEDGGAGAPILVESATPNGLPAVRFDGNDQLGLSITENPFAEQTAMSVVMVVRSTVGGSGLETTPFGTTGILDASVSGGLGWGLSLAGNGRFGWSLDDLDGSVDALFRGDIGNGSTSEGDWHVVVATWDGSEISNDNAGDDQNMKVFVDSIDQQKTRQGPNHFNIARDSVSLLLGNSRTNSVGGFQGDIAEIRLYSGELQLHEVDRLLTALRARYLSGTPGVAFERPWSSHLTIEAGQSLQTRGLLTGGGQSMEWTVASGPGAVTFSNVFSPNTEMQFAAVGSYTLSADVSDGVSTGHTELFVEVVLPSAHASVLSATDPGGSWISSTIGAVGLSGSTALVGDTWTLQSAGKGVGVDVGATYDSGQFLWKGIAGDFDSVVRLDSIANVEEGTRAGLMVRGGPGATDSAAFIGFAPDGTLYTMSRYDGGWYAEVVSDATIGLSFPLYLKLERRGKVLRGYLSSDGSSYGAAVLDAEICLPGVARVGLFGSSGDPANLGAAVFTGLALKQRSYAKASRTVFSQMPSFNGLIELAATGVGSDEPWLSMSAHNGSDSLTFHETYSGAVTVSKAYPTEGGDYSVRLALDDGNALSFDQRSVVVDFIEANYFETNGDAEGWVSNHVTDFTVLNGVLSGVASTNDPQISRSGVSLPGGSYTKAIIRLKASINTTVQLYWARDGASGFSGTRVLSQSYTGSGAFQTLTFDLDGLAEWDGERITALRMDPLSGTSASGQSFEIDSIILSDGATSLPLFNTRFDLDGDFLGWTVKKDLVDSYVLDGALQATTSGIDSILEVDPDNFLAETVSGVLIRFRSSIAGNLQLFWATSENDSFATERSQIVAHPGSNAWTTLYIPLAGNVEWDGKTITRLRLDPTNQASESIALDAIVLSDGDADGDVIPDSVEALVGLDALNASDASGDFDGDGQSNLFEYLAGSGLASASDRFLLTATKAETGTSVAFGGKSGRTYRLLRKQSLTDASWTFVKALGPLSSDQSVILEDTALFDQAFYQVEISF